MRDWFAERLTTTPGKLVLASILVVAGAVCFGVIASVSARERAQAAQAVQTQTEPLLVQAATLYTALSDANATVTTALLSGGLEPPAKRARYLYDLRVASDALTTLTREAGTSPSTRAAVRTIAQQLPTYAGLVESARANNRQGFPIGAAYLRQASGRLTKIVLPAADQLYATEALRLSDKYGTGSATISLVGFIVAVGIALVLLLVVQRYVAIISRRVFNIPMLAASAVLVAASIWGLSGLLSGQNGLASARRDGSDPVELLSATSVLLSRAQSDQSLALVNRGTDESDARDFAAVLPPLGGLVANVSTLPGQAATSEAAHQLVSQFASYQTQTKRIGQLQSSGQIASAIHQAPRAAATSDRMRVNLADQTIAAQRHFESSAAGATSSLAGLSLAIPLLTVLVAALALLGLRQRINEYR